MASQKIKIYYGSEKLGIKNPPRSEIEVISAVKKVFGVGDGMLYDSDGDIVMDSQLAAGEYTFKPTAKTWNGPGLQVFETEAAVARELLKLSGEQVRVGRKRRGPGVPHDDHLGDKLSVLGIGNKFTICGRDETYNVLLRGAARMFNVFMHPQQSPTDHMRQRPFLFGMIAYPGAGKTTMGTRGWSFLQENWDKLTIAQKYEILEEEQLSHEDAIEFVKMVDASLNYNLVLYSDLALNPGLEGVERSLPSQHVLALRCLHSIVNYDRTLSYSDFLYNLTTRFLVSDEQRKFTLTSVLCFLRQALGLLVEDPTRLLVTFFFDEANSVEQLPGFSSTWFQNVMAAYVRECHSLAYGTMFTAFTYATTSYTAGDLLRTPSARAHTILVPFRLLTEVESETAVRGFFFRLAELLHLEPPTDFSPSFRYILRMAGGNPRTLATAIKLLADGVRHPRSLYDSCTSDIPRDLLEDVVQKTQDGFRGHYVRYLEGYKGEMLLKVLAVSLTGHARVPCLSRSAEHRLQLFDVTRDSKVLQTMDDVYGHLEDAGLVALTPTPPGVQEVTDLGSNPVKVRCTRMFVTAVVSESAVEWPDLLSHHYREKELADVQTLVLRIWLCHHVLKREYFTLEQILSPGAVIPPALKGKEYTLEPGCGYNIQERSLQFETKDDIGLAFVEYGLDCIAILAGGNNEVFDSIVRLQHNKERVYLVLVSKQTTSNKTRGAEDLLDNFRKDCQKFWSVPTPTEDDFVESNAYGSIVPERQYLTRSKTGSLASSSRSESDHQASIDRSDSNQPAIDEAEDLKDLIFLYCTNRRASPGFLQDPQDNGLAMIYQCEEEALNYGDAISVIAEVRKKY